jgi:hypothetical protein
MLLVSAMAPNRLVSMQVLAALAWLLIGTAGAAVQHGDVTPAGGWRAFEEGVAQYAALRARFEEPLPAFDNPRRDGWTLLLMRRYLASAIRTARRGAQPGCIFGPAALLVRETIAGAIYDVEIEGLAGGALDEDELELDLVLNEPIPPWAMSAVPAPLVERLPPLPPAIEYRLAGGALILWDVHAEILIDTLPDAFVSWEEPEVVFPGSR